MAVDTFDLPALSARSRIESPVGCGSIPHLSNGQRTRTRAPSRQGIWEPMTREGVGFPKACSGRINKRAHIRFSGSFSDT